MNDLTALVTAAMAELTDAYLVEHLPPGPVRDYVRYRMAKLHAPREESPPPVPGNLSLVIEHPLVRAAVEEYLKVQPPAPLVTCQSFMESHAHGRPLQGDAPLQGPNLTISDYLDRVLAGHSEGLRVAEIVNRMIELGWETTSRTPENGIQGAISRQKGKYHSPRRGRWALINL